MTTKILMIYTGGTIGMESSANGYTPVPGFESLIRSRLAHSHHALLPEFDMLELNPLIDSANLIPSHWTEMADIIIQKYEDYDGFIVLHGTDTMAYSASMLSFILQGLSKPVIFTGSQIPLSQLRNDALDNLITTLLLATDNSINEVCIYFSGRLLRGNRSSKVKATGLDAFNSPNFPWLGQVGLNVELHSNLFLPQKQPRFLNPEFKKNAVVILPIYPGINGKHVELLSSDPDCKAIILRSYGVGNLPDQNQELIDALKAAAQRGVIFVNNSQCLQAEIFQGQYACSSILNEIGVISGAEMTLEACFCKLHFLLATLTSTAMIKNNFVKSLAGEISR
ncbi:type I asparaginase [Neptuniibacter sp. 2_MG-2023]|uniref:type I asparaginase n=1 Tax=Neptuniibacter sp. 2_MG-2023 TaxID=3062671 RepID=UPI0026E36E47|nr:type I asparaginase [Neptuniibacter sp. 2_MG-2023]MDO6512749.1 type I asparaginase [Neptuniibacter sp. 2_MG-2023]